MVGFDVCNPCIFRRVLFFLGEVEQNIETREVLVILNGGLSLLLLKKRYFTNCFQKVVNQLLLCFTKADVREAARLLAPFLWLTQL